MNQNTFKDYGGAPLLLNLPAAAERNKSFRQTLFTGDHLQLTVMHIPVGEEIGIEMHADLDQMLRIEEGVALIRIGDTRDRMQSVKSVGSGFTLLVPAGTYHNVVNAGNSPLSLSSVYAPPAHPKGTVHKTKKDAEGVYPHEG